MATVTNNLTRIHDAEGTLTTSNWPSGGGGAGANTDIFLQGSQSLGRRQTTTGTAAGFILEDGANNDVSATDVHVGFWFWVTQYALLDDVKVGFASNTGSPTNFDSHNFDYTNEYPSLGGWIRCWVDISRTPDTTGGTGLDETALRTYGIQVSFSATPGGTSPNLIIDSCDYTNGGAGLTLTGTSGVWSDFSTSDQNSTNQYGVFRRINGIFQCYARVQLGTSGSSIVFSDSNFTIAHPQQSLVNDTFMGITIDLQNASTDITLTNGSILNPGTKKGDFIVTGTSGDLTLSGISFSGSRIITLNSKVVGNGCIFTNCGQITGAGATLLNSSVSGYTGATDTSALVWDIATDPDGYLDGSTFTKGSGTTHAIEFGTTSPTTMTLTDVDFSGYNASNGQNDSAIHIKRTTGTVTINISGGTSPSYKTDGATVVIVSGTVNLTINVKSAATGSNIQNARVFTETSDGTGPFPYNASITSITRSGSTATVTTTSAHGLETNDKVVIRGVNENEYNGIVQITVTGTSTFTYTVSGSPATPATGTITFSFVPIEGLTDASGNITTSRVYASPQPIKGTVRKASSAPYYKSAGITGTVSNTLGFNTNIQLISDD